MALVAIDPKTGIRRSATPLLYWVFGAAILLVLIALTLSFHKSASMIGPTGTAAVIQPD
jgi:hypothetical protein